MENIIKIQNLTKSYKVSIEKDSFLYKDKIVLDNINLNINKGKINAIVGRSGAGKTTLLKILLGMTSKDSGSILFNDKEIKEGDSEYLENIGYFMGSDFYSNLTIKENLELHCKFYGFHAIEEIDIWLKKLGVEDYKDNKVDEVPKGVLQKIGLVRAMVTSPQVLILDEPFNFIDYEDVVYVRELLTEINETIKTTIIITSHAIKELEVIANKVIFLDKGKLVEAIEMKDIKRKFNNTIVLKCNNSPKALMILENKLNLNNMQLTKSEEILITSYDDVAMVSKVLVENNIDILSIRAEDMTLEKYLLLRGDESL